MDENTGTGLQLRRNGHPPCMGVGNRPGSGASCISIDPGPPSPHTTHPVPLQNEPIVEYDRNPNPLRDELLTTPITLQKGKLPVPHNPGLGIEVNLDAVSKYGSEF